MTATRYTALDAEWTYEPRYYVGTLDWFNLAQCARARMTDYAFDVHRWRGERRSFYSALQRMHVDEVGYMDEA